MEALFIFYQDLPRQGPGNPATSLKALHYIRQYLPAKPSVLDIGCGSGVQTLTLAEELNGQILAIDIYQPYLDRLINEAEKRSLRASVTCQAQNMTSLTLPDKSFDLIWSEGAVYIIGVDKALQDWSRFLKPNGFIVFSEMSWLRDDPDQHVQKYWRQNYPQMRSVEGNITAISDHGFEVIENFTLAEQVWWSHFYHPIQTKIKRLQNSENLDAEIRQIIVETEEEMEMFRRYASFYGYQFYIARKNDIVSETDSMNVHDQKSARYLR